MSTPPAVALAGCGAVTTEYYLPTLIPRSLTGRLRIVALYDPFQARLDAVGERVPQAVRAKSFEQMLAVGADLVIIASPPALHATQSIAALRSGSNVFCEKPMALTLKEGEAIVATAAATSRFLAVGMVRRYFPATAIVQTLLSQGVAGAVTDFSVFEGGPFRWPVSDPRYFSRKVSGGGVLADVGVHVIDLLSIWLGPPQLIAAADDAMGGVEANSLITMRFGDTPGSIRLSRDWERPNKIELGLERGTIRWRAEDPGAVELVLRGSPPMRVTSAGPADFLSCFGAQIDAVLDHLAGRPTNILNAVDALPAIALMEEAYCQRRLMAMPWLE